jgi:hypothetical protein
VRTVLVAAFVLSVAAVGALPAAGERQADLLVRYGDSIGKVKLGMTLPQVRKLLGRERAVSVREKRGRRGYVYLELEWDYAWWMVGFMRPRVGPFKAVMVGTIRRSAKTPEGLRVTSTDSELRRQLPDVRCRSVSGTSTHVECVHGRPGKRQTVFRVGFEHRNPDDPGLQMRIEAIEVRDPLFYRGWRVTFRPYP